MIGLKDDKFSSIFIVVLELDKSIGIDDVDCSILFVFVVDGTRDFS